MACNTGCKNRLTAFLIVRPIWPLRDQSITELQAALLVDASLSEFTSKNAALSGRDSCELPRTATQSWLRNLPMTPVLLEVPRHQLPCLAHFSLHLTPIRDTVNSNIAEKGEKCRKIS